jgi:hypothetical protein
VECRRPSLRLDAGSANDLTPLLSFIDYELVEVGGRKRQRRATQVSEPRDDLWISKPRIDLPVELVDDLGGRILRSADRDPGVGLETRQKLSERRNVWQRRRARCGRDRERAQPGCVR